MAKVKVNIGRTFRAVSRGAYEGVEAIYELVDNALDADAENIKIGVFENNKCVGTNIEKMVASDDGCGMNPAELMLAVSLAGDCNRGNNEIGEFGVGLNAATFSQGDDVIIVTKCDGGVVIGAYMNYDLICAEDGEYEGPNDPNPTKDYAGIWSQYAIDPDATGTVIVIENIRKETSLKKGASFVKNLKDRTALPSRYWLRLRDNDINISVALNEGGWRTGGAQLKAFDRLRETAASNKEGYGYLVNKRIRLPEYNNCEAILKITEANTRKTEKEAGAKDDGLGVYYNGTLIFTSRTWLGSRPGNHSDRSHIRGALIFENKSEFQKVFTSAAHKVRAIPLPGLGDAMANKHFGEALTASIVARKARQKARRVQKDNQTMAQANASWQSILNSKSRYPRNLSSYSQRITGFKQSTSLTDDKAFGELSPQGELQYNMYNSDISQWMDGDTGSQRFARALATGDAIIREMESQGNVVTATDVMSLICRLMRN